MKPTLRKALTSLADPGTLPLALPLTHMSSARLLGQIVKDGGLQPMFCPVFGSDLVYLFYGGIFYRSSNLPTQNVSEAPIAFVFKPSAAKYTSKSYPFDTGALHRGFYAHWTSRLNPTGRFAFTPGKDLSSICKFIHYVFRDNTNYLQGNADSTALGPADEPLPELLSFLCEDLTGFGTDHRKNVIELLSKTTIPFKNNLLWIAFPESMTSEIGELYDLMGPDLPKMHPYSSKRVLNPIEIAAILEEKAFEAVVKNFVTRLV